MSSKFTREILLSICAEVIRNVDTRIRKHEITDHILYSAINFLHYAMDMICMITRPYGCVKCHDQCDSFIDLFNKMEEYRQYRNEHFNCESQNGK